MNEALNIDCIEYMKTVPYKYFDLAIVDPPYGDGNWGAKDFVSTADRGCENTSLERASPSINRVGYYNRFGAKFDKYKVSLQNRCDMGGEIHKKNIAWDVAPNEQYFKELFRISRNQIIWGGNYFNLPPTRCFLVWRKLTISENFSMAMVEYAWTSFNENAKCYEKAPQDKERFHPTQKPVDLYEWILNRYANKGDKIFDSHMGSGSSRIACYRLGFDFVGCEIDKEYFDRQEQRFQNETTKMRLF